MQVTVDRTAALEQGLTEIQVLGIVAGTLSPQSVGSIALDGEELDIYIEGPDAPATVAELEQLILPTAAGFAPLSSRRHRRRGHRAHLDHPSVAATSPRRSRSRPMRASSER